MTDLRCMTFTTKGTSEILVAGCQSQMFRIDVEKGVVAEMVRGYSYPLSTSKLTLHSCLARVRTLS